MRKRKSKSIYCFYELLFVMFAIDVNRIVMQVFSFTDASPVAVGQEAKNRAKLDTARRWTMVSTNTFKTDGEVRSFDVYSGAANRRLRVGIYRPTGKPCQFKLMQQKEFSSIAVGKQTVGFDSFHKFIVF